MNGLELFECIKEATTLGQLLLSVVGKTSTETQSKIGNLFEKLVVFIIIFGFHPSFPSDQFSHFDGNINTGQIKEITNLEI